ncbi:MAG TPA: LLM class flavin-dependent oxidoreductase [Candidatus Binataceae bacterium]|nr:LLM class flavin-dependent oxidoreductase [Candidatus Binataceae bacterium]
MRPIKFDVHLPAIGFNHALAFAELAESLGFYCVSFGDHIFMNMTLSRSVAPDPKTPKLECYTTLAALAAVTKRVRLMTNVTPIGFRNPALLAKMTSTLDVISGGRLIAGLGTGWLRQEFDACGIPFPDNRERTERLAEGIAILKSMWTEEETNFRGKYYSVTGGVNFPKPVQRPHPPIMLGGFRKPIIGLAARQADIVNLVPPGRSDMGQLNYGAGRFKDKLVQLEQDVLAAGRDAEAIELSSFSFVLIAADKSEARAMLNSVGDSVGLSSEQVLRSPMVLAGTPAELRRLIRNWIEELGTTFFCCVFLNRSAMRLFAEQVMPEFISPVTQV